MNKAVLIFPLIAILMTQPVFAQSKACQDEKNKAATMKNDCVEINKSKGQTEFNKCLENLKVQVAKANKICEAGNQEPAPAAPAKPTVTPAKTTVGKTPPKTVAAPAKAPSSSKTASSPKPAAEADTKKKDPVPDIEESNSRVAEPEPEPEPEAQKPKPSPLKAVEPEEDDIDEDEQPFTKTAKSEDDNYEEYKQSFSNNKDNEAAKARKNGDEIRFGVRANISAPRVFPSLIVGNIIGQELFIDGGVGSGLGGFLIIPVSSFHFVPEISIQYRKPININSDYFNLAITETAIEIPLMFRFLYSEGNLVYFGVGLFAGITLDLTEEPPQMNGTEGIKEFRSTDYGLVLEIGFRIDDNFSIDARGTASAASYGIGEYLNSGDTPRLLQAQIGVNYTF